MTTTADTLHLGYRPNSPGARHQREVLSTWPDDELDELLDDLGDPSSRSAFSTPSATARLKTSVGIILQRRLIATDLDRAVAAADTLTMSALINAAANTDPIRDNR